MNWFGSSRGTEPGWLVIATRDNRLSFVHGHRAPAGQCAVTRFGQAEVEAKPHALEKLGRELHFDRYQCATPASGFADPVAVLAPVAPATAHSACPPQATARHRRRRSARRTAR